jgi:single-stranded-DNA-specific exonuclease
MSALPETFGPGTEEEQPYLGVSRSVRGLRWRERLAPSGAAIALAIAQQHGLPDLLARILAARGADLHTVHHFLDPALRTLMPDPESLADMGRAAARFATAIVNDEPIAIFGDYDVDGAASIALVQRFLGAFGRKAKVYVPDRLTEGYGPSPAALASLAENTRLILTVDCGTSSSPAIEAANHAGADVIVIDHHQADELLPPAYAVVNPNRLDDLSGQGHLCAAGVVFLFLVAALNRLKGVGQAESPDLLGWMDLVGLATVCDVAPLRGVNRAFVAKGLQILRLRHNPGLRALADQAGVAEAPSCFTLGYVLGPRINAGGRVGDSSLGARLLCSDDDLEARSIAGMLERLNAERKAIEERMVEEAMAMAEAMLSERPGSAVIALGRPDWHKGVVGLIASRLCQNFRLPAAIVAWDGAEGTGSMRSVRGVDAGSVLRAAVEENWLIKGGGHPMAGGFSLHQSSFAGFADFLQRNLAQTVAAATADAALFVDGTLSAGGITRDLMSLLERAGPFGPGHAEPRFVLANHRRNRLRIINEAHLRFELRGADGGCVQAAAFKAAGTPLGEHLMRAEERPLHVAGHLRRDRWNGRDAVELIVEDAAEPHGRPG